MPAAQMTTDHQTIRQWAESRGGKPATVKGTGGKEDAGLLRIDFPDAPGDESLRKIPWESFFEKFDDKELALLYQDRTEQGQPSRFCKIVHAPQGVLRTLHQEHEQVLHTLDQMEHSRPTAAKSRTRLLEKLKQLVIPHMQGEEKRFYTLLQARLQDPSPIIEAIEEHWHARQALQRLERSDPASEEWSARAKVLQELLEHHIQEEESEIFDMARNLLGADGLNDALPKYQDIEHKAKQRLSA